MRGRNPEAFPVRSLVTVFWLQAVLLWAISAPLPANAGRVMDRGFWRSTPHPNYFGDAVVWWAFFCLAAATQSSGWTVYSPLLMTLLLMRVSGVTLLEKKLQRTRPAYRLYAEETSAFFPWFPRRRC